MNIHRIETERLNLILQTKEEARAFVDQLPPQERAEISESWLAQLAESGHCNPWIHGFVIVLAKTGAVIGRYGFKGLPSSDGKVEIAYGLAPEYQGKGYATEAAAALVRLALSQKEVRIVCAHTLPQPTASAKVLTKCGFSMMGEVMDPDDGLVWRWELSRQQA